MQKKVVNFLFFLCLSGFVFLWYSNTRAEEQGAKTEPQVLGTRTASSVLHKDYDYNWELYYKAVEKIKQNQPPGVTGKILGGVVPHHLLASELIADLYARFAIQTGVKTVVIIGPNHTEAGSYWALTTTGSWETPKGTVAANIEIIDALERKGVLKEDTTVLDTEHTISSQIPFVAEFLPGATVVPIILSANSSQEEVSQLVEALKPHITEQTVVVASVDFSHYLDSATAQKMDSEMREVLKQRAYEELFRYAKNSNHTDSAASLATLLQMMDGVGADKMEVLANSNSGIILHDDAVPTTSYFEIIFTR